MWNDHWDTIKNKRTHTLHHYTQGLLMDVCNCPKEHMTWFSTLPINPGATSVKTRSHFLDLPSHRRTRRVLVLKYKGIGLHSNSGWQLSLLWSLSHWPSFIYIHSAHFSKMHIRLEVHYLLLQWRQGLNSDSLTRTQGNITVIKLQKRF